MSSPSDDPQIARTLAQLGSIDPQQPWSRFLDVYSPAIYQVVQVFEREPDPISDCFVFVCEQLSRNRFRRLRSFKPEGKASFRKWLCAVVRNLCLDWRRKELGRYRVFRSIARLEALDQEVFSCVYERGLAREEAFSFLGVARAGLTEAALEQSLERIRQALTPRQLWLISARHPRVESLDNDSADSPRPTKREPRDPAPDPETHAAIREQAAALDRGLSRLSKPERLLVRLRFEQSLTLREIAGLVDLKDAQTADRKIQEILEKLRKELDA